LQKSGDKGYDANGLRKTKRENGNSPVIPGRRKRKRAIRYDQQHSTGRGMAARTGHSPRRRKS
jgi:hypothetical protein